MPFALALLVAALVAPAQIGPTPTLPAGDSTAFRARMLSWAPASVPELRVAAALPAVPTGFGRVTSGFGRREDPIDSGLRVHEGIDIAAALGMPVRAAAEGVVDRAGVAGGYGNLVEIAHGDGVRTRYGHLSRIVVASGQHVSAGQVIGLIGSTGRSTGPHLHYEVRVAGRAIDPLSTHPITLSVGDPDPLPVVARWTGWHPVNGLLPLSSF